MGRISACARGIATLAEFAVGKSCGRNCAGDRLGNYSAMIFPKAAQRLPAIFRRFNNINAASFGPRLAWSGDHRQPGILRFMP